jgi:fatty acyl-CoA reductase
MDTETESTEFPNLTNIQSFFYGQSVFITGVSGLVGKVVLEKLLRSCPGIGMIYVLLRPKRNVTPENRLEKILNLELFKEVEKIFPLFRKNIKAVVGDISEKKLGISFEDYETIKQNVTIVIHSAASVNFKDPIKYACEYNVLATKRVLELCLEIPNIKAVVHVSTAFVQREADGSVVEEIPKSKISPDQLIEALSWMDENTQKAMQDFLTGKILTTYLVTKAMAEVLINEKKKDLPLAIVRPSYISATTKEPFPGWIDQLQGLSGLLLAGAKGVLRTLVILPGLKINIVPVDLVSNTIVTSAWYVGTTRPINPFIINCVLDYEDLPLADEEILAYAMKKRDEFPLSNMFRYPDFKIYHNRFFYGIHAFIDQWIPAMIVDLLLLVFTGRPILFKVYNKINLLYDIVAKLGKDPWICRVENFNYLKSKLSEKDTEIFNMNTKNFNWNQYIDSCLLGGRKFLAKEDPSNIPYAKRKAKIWWAVTTIIKWMIILYLFNYLLTSSMLKPLYSSAEDIVHRIR